MTKYFSHPILQWKATILSRPHCIRLYKLILVTHTVHIDFNIHILFKVKQQLKRKKSTVNECEYSFLHYGFWILKHSALHRKLCGIWNPLKLKVIFDAHLEQSRTLSTIQKTEDLRLQGTLLHNNENYKTEKWTKIFYLLDISRWLPILLINMMGTYRLIRFLYCTMKSCPCFIMHTITLS